MATPSLLFQNPNAPGTSQPPMGSGLQLPNMVGALPMPADKTLVRDPVTGAFSVPTPAPAPTQDGATQPAQNGAPQQDPYAIFLSNITAMLKDAQGKNATAQKNLGGAKNFLVNESIAPNGAKPFDPGVFSGTQVQNQETLQKGFEPAITSINTQMENENKSLENINALAGTLAQFYHPQAISPGQSLVTPDGTVIKDGHSYSPTINSITGLMDGFDQNTGTWASEDARMRTGGGVTTSQTLTKAGIVGGIDLSGKSVGMKPWATDPNYVQEVDGLYKQIVGTQPIPSAQSLDTIIKSMAKSSPVTGAMIMNAAATYKIDPNLLAAVLGHESDFGTLGAATSTMNPGNVGNTGTSTQNFGSWTQGVNGAAQALARRIVGPNVATATSPVGGQFSPTASQKIGQLPQAMQSYVDAGPKGVAYINSDRVPDNLRTSVQTMASRAGIPFLDAADAQAIKSIGVVYQAIGSMKKLVDTNLGSGYTGRAYDIGASKINDLFQNNPDLTKFTSYRDTAIKAVQALAGGAGSGLRINGAEIEANVSNLPNTTDNAETANAKLTQLSSFLDQQLGATFPYIKEGTGDAGGLVTMTGPKGTFHVTPDQVAVMEQNGYAKQ